MLPSMPSYLWKVSESSFTTKYNDSLNIFWDQVGRRGSKPRGIRPFKVSSQKLKVNLIVTSCRRKIIFADRGPPFKLPRRFSDSSLRFVTPCYGVLWCIRMSFQTDCSKQVGWGCFCFASFSVKCTLDILLFLNFNPFPSMWCSERSSPGTSSQSSEIR